MGTVPVLTLARAAAATPTAERRASEPTCEFSGQPELGQRQPSGAVSRIRNSGRSTVLGVEANRFDDEVEFVGTVDFARYTVRHAGLNVLSFGEVMEPVNTLRIAVLQQEHCARTIFRPREKEEMIGAEVEHERRKETRSGSRCDLRPLAAPLRGYPADFSVSGYHHSAALARGQ